MSDGSLDVLNTIQYDILASLLFIQNHCLRAYLFNFFSPTKGTYTDFYLKCIWFFQPQLWLLYQTRELITDYLNFELSF